MSSKLVLGMVVLLLAVGSYWAQEKKPSAPPATTAPAATAPPAPHEFKITKEDEARKNPVKFTQTSVDRGKKIYGYQCAMCHGKDGDGKGDLVEELKVTMPDFTKPDTLKDRTDGALFTILGEGNAPMPGQAGRMPDRQKWDLVNYLRTLEGKTPAKSTGKEPEENVITVPQ
jgi:mono/diheme cytochrome c family protein